jgi:hypothetical protein
MTAMDIERNNNTNMYRSLWLRGALDEPEEFVRVRDTLMRKCYAHVARMEFGEMLSLARALHWVGPYCLEEPYVSKYEQAIGKLGTLAAYAASQLRDYEMVYTQLELVRNMLESSARRRKDLGFAPWPHSEIKLHFLRTLGDCKVQDSKAEPNRLYSPQEMFELYELLYSRYTAFMEEHEVTGKAAKVNWDNLSHTGGALVKVCARFTPQLLVQQIQRFNRRFGANMALGVGHFRNNHALGGVWYWDFEITKLNIAGELTMKDLEFCHERLLKAAMAEAPEATIFHQALKTEYFWLAKAIQRRDKPGLEVVSG